MLDRRRRRTARESGPPPGVWLVTYADMVTLVLTFFVLIFAYSQFDAERFQVIISSFQSALGLLDGGPSVTQTRGDAGGSILDALVALRSEAGMAEAFSVEVTERGIVIHFVDRVLFDLGEAELRPEAIPVLRRVIETLETWPYDIRVEGHTDNLPIATERFPSNWELSAARAARVIRFLLEESQIKPERLSAAGYGEYRPIASNSTPEGRARNRRVDIVLVDPEGARSAPGARLSTRP